MISILPTSKVFHLLPYLKDERFSVIKPEFNRDNKNIFPDGEVYVKLSKTNYLKEGKVVILHSGSPNPNSGLVELEMILSILRSFGVSDLEVFFTYFPYGMQDKVFQIGETNAAEDLVTKLLYYYKVKKIYAIEPHFSKELWLEKYPFVSISAHEIMIESAKKKHQNVIFVAPDLGHERRTKIKGFKKTRVDSYNVTIEHDKSFMESLEGKTVGVIDDIIETGGTMCKFYDECEKYHLKEIFAVATHGIMKSGIERIREKYKTLYLSNTVATQEANVNIVSLILDNITK